MREDWAELWPSVEEYLERIIPIVMKGSLTSKEGPVQAAVSVYRGDSTRTLLDRETIVGFINKRVRQEVIGTFSAEVVAAIASGGFTGGPPRFGPKCDVLALHQDGYLEAIEVKPEDVASLAWVPAQATMCAKLLNYWIGQDPDWYKAISRMYAQREALG